MYRQGRHDSLNITYLTSSDVNKNVHNGWKFIRPLAEPSYLYSVIFLIFLNFLKILFIFRERERDREKHQSVVASQEPPTGDLACKPGMHPDWESNQKLFASQSGAQSTEPHQPGLYPDSNDNIIFKNNIVKFN